MQKRLDPADAALEFLWSRINYERSAMPPGGKALKLDRMRRLLAAVGDPHRGLRAIHIAGTKGKGSTAAMVAAILQAAGCRAGLYTSPHLERLEERFAVDGQIVTRQQLTELIVAIQPVMERMDARGDRCTFFEATTAIAWLHFAQQRVDCAVIEVGLGGRLDSTNVIWPEVSVITHIGLDHRRQLGETLAEIAWEKAGIIKPGVPVVSTAAAEPAATVIARAAEERGAPLLSLGRDFEVRNFSADAGEDSTRLSGLTFDYVAAGRTLEQMRLPLIGEEQAANAAAAITATTAWNPTGRPLSEAVLRRGLSEVRLPARIERIGERPTVYVDGAHNGDSVAALCRAIVYCHPKSRRILVFATSKDKELAAMAPLLSETFDAIWLTEYRGNPRRWPLESLASAWQAIAAPPPGQIRLEPDPLAAWRAARVEASAEDVVCVAGSFFIAGELRPVLLAESAAPTSPLT